MNQEVKDILNQRRKLFVLGYANAIGNVRNACKELGIPKSYFYDWKKHIRGKIKLDFYGTNQLLNHTP